MIAIRRERERARNRRGGHRKKMRRALIFQPCALRHSEAMLLVHDHQLQIVELHRVFD